MMNSNFQTIQTSESPQMNLTIGIVLSVLFLFILNGLTDHKTAWEILKPLLP